MRGFTFYERILRAFHDHPTLSKLVVLSSVRFLSLFYPFYLIFFSVFIRAARFLICWVINYSLLISFLLCKSKKGNDII